MEETPFLIAAAQVAPVFLDRSATIDETEPQEVEAVE